MKNSVKVVLGLFLICVIGSIFTFGAILPLFTQTKTLTPLGIVGLVFLVGALVFGLMLYVRFLLVQSFGISLFFAWLPITMAFAMVAYLVLPSSTTSFAFVRLATANGTNNFWLFSAIFLLYVLVMFVVFMFASMPIYRLQKATARLGDGMVGGSFHLGVNRQIKDIEYSLGKINQNYKQDSQKTNQTHLKVEKWMPKQSFSYFSAKNIMDLEVGEQVQKEATLLFCHVQSQDTRVDLEQHFECVSAYLHIISPIVDKFGGFLDKYLGEGITAIFFEPEQAINCCKAIFASIASNVDLHKKNIKVNIAMHSDGVLFGVTGDEKHKSLTVMKSQMELENKLQDINRFFCTFAIFSAPTLHQLPYGFPLKYRYIGRLKEPFNMPVFENLEVYLRIKQEKLLSVKNDFEQAVGFYEGGDYAKAKNIFAQILKKIKEDRVSYVYFNLSDERLKEQND